MEVHSNLACSVSLWKDGCKQIAGSLTKKTNMLWASKYFPQNTDTSF